jgi:hypothetical protein
MASIFQKKTRLPADADLMQARGKKIYVQENKTQAAEQEWKRQYVRAGAVQTRWHLDTRWGGGRERSIGREKSDFVRLLPPGR